jgi:TadE-like protein
MKSTARGRRHQRRGVSITELALFLPILVLLAMGTIEACSMIYLKQTLEIAAYEGARVALNPAATSENVEGQALQITTDREITDAAVAITPADITMADVGTFVRVSVTAPCSANSLFGSMFYSDKSLRNDERTLRDRSREYDPDFETKTAASPGSDVSLVRNLDADPLGVGEHCHQHGVYGIESYRVANRNRCGDTRRRTDPGHDRGPGNCDGGGTRRRNAQHDRIAAIRP